MKKIIALDIGNVLYYVKNENFLETLGDLLGYDGDDEEQMCSFINLFCNFTDIGLLKLDDIFLCTNAPENKKEAMRKAWNSVIVRCDPMMNFVEELLNKDYSICLISNIGPDHTKILREDPIINKCKQYFSYEIGGRKPHMMFFDYVKKDLSDKYGYYNPLLVSCGLLKSDIVYFDDRQENIDAASKFFTSHMFNLHDYDTEKEAVDAMKEKLSLYGISV